VTLVGAGAANLGLTQRVIVPFDLLEQAARPGRLRVVRPGKWRRACRTLIADDVPPGGLKAARHARIELLPYQLEPAMAVVRGLGSRLLLADDVGLGKTIQAGLIVAELVARGAIERVLIVTPAGLCEQWIEELRMRFRIEAVFLDSAEIRRRVALLPVGINPWSTVPVAIASFDYIKRPETLPAVAMCRWDLLIVDEAHRVASESDRHRAIASLASRAAYVGLLTATPHNGDPTTFASLCDLGTHGDRLLVFRRTRSEVNAGNIWVHRHIHRLMIRPSPAERRMHVQLERFTDAVRRERPRDSSAWLALIVLHKRALSSAHSLGRSVERRLESITGTAAGAFEQLGLPLTDASSDLDRTDDPIEWPAAPVLKDAGRERELLHGLADAARLASRHERKVAALLRLLDRIVEPVVVFTEYRDTLFWLRDAIGRPAAVLHGGLLREERAAALHDFISGRCSVLVATDAAGEGLNLHHACRVVINLELPWNPMRLEQRIGRVDRIGQRRTVHAFHLVARETGEERILERMRARIACAQQVLAAADPLSSMGSTTDDEEASARLVIDRLSAEPEVDSSGNDADVAETRRVVSLRLDASTEAARASQARAIASEEWEDAMALVETSGPWLTRAATRITRSNLGTRTVFIARAVCENASGGPVESKLVAATCRGNCQRPSFDQLAGLIEHAVWPELISWKRDALAVAHHFMECRLVRERAIARFIEGGGSSGHTQPGLFDRRELRRHLDDEASHSQTIDEVRLRLDHLDQLSHFDVRPAHLLLVLTP
jgi:superfamily II DNA or RNA helicase